MAQEENLLKRFRENEENKFSDEEVFQFLENFRQGLLDLPQNEENFKKLYSLAQRNAESRHPQSGLWQKAKQHIQSLVSDTKRTNATKNLMTSLMRLESLKTDLERASAEERLADQNRDLSQILQTKLNQLPKESDFRMETADLQMPLQKRKKESLEDALVVCDYAKNRDNLSVQTKLLEICKKGKFDFIENLEQPELGVLADFLREQKNRLSHRLETQTLSPQEKQQLGLELKTFDQLSDVGEKRQTQLATEAQKSGSAKIYLDLQKEQENFQKHLNQIKNLTVDLEKNSPYYAVLKNFAANAGISDLALQNFIDQMAMDKCKKVYGKVLSSQTAELNLRLPIDDNVLKAQEAKILSAQDADSAAKEEKILAKMKFIKVNDSFEKFKETALATKVFSNSPNKVLHDIRSAKSDEILKSEPSSFTKDENQQEPEEKISTSLNEKEQQPVADTTIQNFEQEETSRMENLLQKEDSQKETVLSALEKNITPEENSPLQEAIDELPLADQEELSLEEKQRQEELNRKKESEDQLLTSDIKTQNYDFEANGYLLSGATYYKTEIDDSGKKNVHIGLINGEEPRVADLQNIMLESKTKSLLVNGQDEFKLRVMEAALRQGITIINNSEEDKVLLAQARENAKKEIGWQEKEIKNNVSEEKSEQNVPLQSSLQNAKDEKESISLSSNLEEALLSEKQKAALVASGRLSGLGEEQKVDLKWKDLHQEDKTFLSEQHQFGKEYLSSEAYQTDLQKERAKDLTDLFHGKTQEQIAQTLDIADKAFDMDDKTFRNFQTSETFKKAQLNSEEVKLIDNARRNNQKNKSAKEQQDNSLGSMDKVKAKKIGRLISELRGTRQRKGKKVSSQTIARVISQQMDKYKDSDGR